MLKLAAMGWPVLHTMQKKSLVVLCVVSSSFINFIVMLPVKCIDFGFRLDVYVVSILWWYHTVSI
jgi:hypothetical protein